MSYDFSGKTVLVTGAASGIGAACAIALDEAKVARLILLDRDADRLEALQLACEVTRHAGNVADEGLWQEIEAANPAIDAAVLNAGIAGTPAPLAKLEFDDWRHVMAVNLDGLFLSLRTSLRKAGKGASIVLTSSATGLKAEPGTGPYGASKAAAIHLARIAAKEAGSRGIRVNAIAPGGVDTALWDSVPQFDELVEQHQGDRQAALATMAQNTPIGRFESADEVAAQILFLLSDLSGTITGTTLVTDGGYSL